MKSTPETIIGIDCGINGALAFYSPAKLEIFDMPTLKINVNGKKKNIIDIYELARIIDDKAHEVKFAIIEKVTATPQMGVTSAFTFGKAAGIAEMAIAANFIPQTFIRPQEWKKALGLNRDKINSRQLASQVMPDYANLWKRSKDDGRAEAALLAYGFFHNRF